MGQPSWLPVIFYGLGLSAWLEAEWDENPFPGR